MSIETKNYTEEEQLKMVRNFIWDIQHIKNPTEKVQLLTIKKYINIGYIKNPTEKVQLEAVKQNKSNIRYIKNPTDKVNLMCL